MADTAEPLELPLLPLRDVVVYPHMVIPLFVGRDKSIRALELAMNSDKEIILAAQKNPDVDEPGTDDLYDIGTVANILQLLKLPDGTVKVLVEGAYRAQINAITAEEDYFRADIQPLDETKIPAAEADVMLRSAVSQFEKFISLSKKIPAEVLTSLSGIEDPGRLADTIAAHMSMELEQKQAVLEMVGERERLEHLMAMMEAEIDLFQVEKRIRGRVKKQMEKSQREYYLNEQMKAIQRELGEAEEGGNELEELEKRVNDAGMSKEALEKARAELSKLKMMSPMSAEASVVRGYVDWLVNIPWQKRSRVKHDLAGAEEILNQDHYGLEEV